MADLPLEALFEDEVEAVVAVFGPDALGFGEAFGGHHAFDELGEVDFGVEGFVDDDFVFLLDALAGVHEAVRKVTAIGHEEEAFAFFIEPSDVVEVLKLGGEEVVDGQAVVGVTAAADVAFGFVEGEDDAFGGAHDAAIDPDFVFVADDGAKAAGVGPVDGDLAFSDDGFDAPARTEATQAKKAVQSHDGRASGGTEKETGINPVSFSEGWWADVPLSRHRGT